MGDGDLRRRIVAVITLAGADTETDAADLLSLLPDLKDPSETGRRHSVAGWGRDLYPGPRWWNPLEPDLLGEHLVATEFAGFAVTRGDLSAASSARLNKGTAMKRTLHRLILTLTSGLLTAADAGTTINDREPVTRDHQ